MVQAEGGITCSPRTELNLVGVTLLADFHWSIGTNDKVTQLVKDAATFCKSSYGSSTALSLFSVAFFLRILSGWPSLHILMRWVLVGSALAAFSARLLVFWKMARQTRTGIRFRTDSTVGRSWNIEAKSWVKENENLVHRS